MAAITGDIPQYVQMHKHTRELVELTTKGIAKPTGKLIAVHDHELRQPLMWGRGVVGVAERVFPHPQEWRLGDIDKPLDKVEVRDITRSFTEGSAKPPNCLAKWLELGMIIDWRTFLQRYKPGLATPKDYGSHFKLILHRAMLTNPHNPSASTHLCRCCGKERESITHFGKCTKLRPVFEFMREFDGGGVWDDVQMNLFGVNDMKGIIPSGTSTLHFMLWKFTLIQLTQASLQGKPISPTSIIDRACLRVNRRVKALQHEIHCEFCRAQSRECEPSLQKIITKLAGLGEVDPLNGAVTLRDILKNTIALAEQSNT
jgi:hypothetical protein